MSASILLFLAILFTIIFLYLLLTLVLDYYLSNNGSDKQLYTSEEYTYYSKVFKILSILIPLIYSLVFYITFT